MKPENSVLIIDDDPATLRLFTEVFLKEGFGKTMGAVTGRQIKDMIRDKKPDIILLDVNIIGEDSLKILKEIKLSFPLMPVIMFAAQKETELAERALQFGACSYVIKSAPVSEIVGEIKEGLARYSVSKKRKDPVILVVDDDKDSADMVKDFLGAAGYSCLAVYDSRKALEIVKSRAPDLIFLDIVMPGMDGIELLDQIKQIDKEAKVVMMSGVTDEEICGKAIAQGASGYIAKPFSLQQLKVTAMTSLLRE